MAGEGFCHKCGRVMDDHDGWLTREGPQCPKPRSLTGRGR